MVFAKQSRLILGFLVLLALAVTVWFLSANKTQELPQPSSAPDVGAETSKTGHYRVALYGDSMQDTMEEHMRFLTEALEAKYPQDQFTIYNYSIVAENVEEGLARFSSSFRNRGRSYPPITKVNPDIIIIGSFAYNPFFPHDPQRHLDGLTSLVKKAQSTSALVYLIAEIAPAGEFFTQGSASIIQLSPAQALEHSQRIEAQLKAVIDLSRQLNVPLINAYAGSKSRRELVNPDDGVHPSDQGHAYTAEKIVETICEAG